MLPRLKRLLKQCLASAVYHSGLLRLVVRWRRRTGRDPGFVILMYHRIVDPGDPTNRYTQAGMSVTHATFKKQVAFLADKYRILSLGKLVEELRSGRRPHPGSVVLTFDDGWRDNHGFAYPVLRTHGAPATIFITVDFVGTDRLFWFLKLGLLVAEAEDPRSVIEVAVSAARRAAAPGTGIGEAGDIHDLDGLLGLMKRLDADLVEQTADHLLAASGPPADSRHQRRWMLDWDEIRTMRQNGIEIGSHGCTHRILTRLPADQVLRELTESKRILERELGAPVVLFAYPNGDWDDSIRSMAEQAGYTAAIATGRTSNDRRADLDLFALGRVGIHEGVSQGWNGEFSPALFACAIHGVFPFR